MSSKVEPEYRLRNLQRQVRDLLLGRRLAADPERTGVVDLSDFAARCEAVAEFAAQSVKELLELGGSRARCAATACEEVELASRLAARLESLPPGGERTHRQCTLLEEAKARVRAALESELSLEEPAALVNPGALAGKEREFFEPFFEFTGRLEAARPGRLEAGGVRRALRRALLEHFEGPFSLRVSRTGVIEFAGLRFEAQPEGETLARGAHEPPEVKKALDLRESAADPALADFLLVKAVDEALFAIVAPQLRGSRLTEQARALPRRPGKRMAVRLEAVRLPIPGWDAKDAARGVERLAARRAGPRWARLPRGAYFLRLFFGGSDELAADLLALGPVLRRMEKGEAVAGTAERAERALRGLVALLG